VPPKKARQPDLELVPSAETMLMQTFGFHCQKRHPHMRLRTRNEHAQDHRLRPEYMDHRHADPEPAEEPADDVAG
jgi:hypothetical protein